MGWLASLICLALCVLFASQLDPTNIEMGV